MKTDLFNGYFWYQDKLFNDLPPDFFPSEYNPETYTSILKELNGCFRLIVEGNDFLIAAVDRVRSLPLFFYQKGKDLFIDPDAFELKKLLNNPELDNLIFTEFLLTAHCCQNDTLYPEIKQLEAGQFLIWHKSEARLELRDYYIYQHLFEPIDNPIEAMDEMHQHIIQRLIDSAHNRTLVIPLSGGYDSRNIAYMLKRADYKNVICFTYGKPYDGDCSASRKVAKFLNFPWIMVENTRPMWYEAFHSDEMLQYFRFSTNLSSSFHVQDWLAVKILKEKELIPSDSIFVPGHSGGALQGQYLPLIFENRDKMTSKELIQTILRQFYHLWEYPMEKLYSLFSDRIGSYLTIPDTVLTEIATSIYDEWAWRQWESKFIVNSVRVYEFFNYEWRIPLWDNEFMEFWQRIPFSQRTHRQLLKQYLQKYQPIPVPAYHDYSFTRRIKNKYARITVGNIMTLGYGRFLDYKDRDAYLNTKIASLLVPELHYPEFINPELPILKAQINAIQALIYIKELVSGNLDNITLSKQF